jgi:hypothetical protein
MSGGDNDAVAAAGFRLIQRFVSPRDKIVDLYFTVIFRDTL